MTVEELIKELEKLPKDKVVMTAITNNFGPINTVTEYSYTVEIGSVIDDN